jgi:hypothetical protein
MIRIASSVFFLAISLAYLVLGFSYSFYTPDGRLGAGFFPRIIGTALVALTVLNVVREVRKRAKGEANEYWRDIGTVAALMFGFVWVMTLFGAVPGMFLFILVVLAMLNPGRWVTNLGVAVGIPLFIHLLFRVWLNAALPIGRFEIPLVS